ncbi:DNA repair and recombination protein RAD54B [Nymphon striatum]|nr:DNA repair and recombination protein RAD54B [Nymphon striatum]
MRRSNAPSQVSSVKRLKFCSPFLNKSNGSPNINIDEKNEIKLEKTSSFPEGNQPDRDSNSILKWINEPTSPEIFHQNSLVQLEKSVKYNSGDLPVSKPLPQFPGPKNSDKKDCDQISTLSNTSLPAYYNVVWCKKSTRKHKRWEGDGILIISGKSAVLQNLEGKEITRAGGYKSKELESLEEGSNLNIGGKEVEISNIIDPADFKSGKCFMSNVENTVPQSNYVPKPFVAPSRNQMQSTKLTSGRTKQLNTPRYNAESPNAFVLPRPPATHQWLLNQNQQPVVDVVVDPHLALKLRPHQKEGIIFLYECVMGFRNNGHLGAILADDMGLGKTLQSISLIWTLLKQGPYGGLPIFKRVVIVTPSSLVMNWLQEFKQWLGAERISVFGVTQNNKVEDFIKSSLHSVLIISYEMFLRSSTILEHIKFDLIICDEGHRLKNANIKTTSIISNTSIKRRIVLTGTPIQNDMQEFFSIVEFCNPGILGTYTGFKKIYEDPILKSNQPKATKDEKDIGEKRAAALNRLISLFTLRRTSEVINKFLPPKGKIHISKEVIFYQFLLIQSSQCNAIDCSNHVSEFFEMVVICKLSDLQMKLYQKLISSKILKSCLLGTRENGMAHLICISALRKLCNHPSLLHQKSVDAENELHEFSTKDSLYTDLLSLFPSDHNAKDLIETQSGKMRVVSKLLHQLHKENNSEKIVLVSSYTQTLDLLQELCNKFGYNTLRLDGSTPSAQRQNLVDKFNNKHDKHTVFLLSAKAGGLGLNLIGACRILLYDIDWNPATDLQAMARVWRDGQKRKVYIYRLLSAGTIEEKMYQRQIMKQGISGSIVDLKELSNVQFTQEDLKDIFSFQENCQSSTHDLLECSCNNTNYQDSPKKVKIETVRSCQLTAPSVPNQSKKLSMGELMQWKHIKGPIIDEDIEDSVLSAAGDEITFIFKN